jgi:ribosomal protein S18 acetylase RimI-like enzyme
MEYGGLAGFVDDLFIREAHRHAGHGTAALLNVREFCAARGMRTLHVEVGQDNVTAQRVYRKAGFVSTDRQLLTLQLAPPTHVPDVPST